MNKIIFEQQGPSGSILINLKELNIVKWLNYITNFTFHKKNEFEEFISKIEKNNQDKILVIVNDNSNHGFVKRCFIRAYTKNELK